MDKVERARAIAASFLEVLGYPQHVSLIDGKGEFQDHNGEEAVKVLLAALEPLAERGRVEDDDAREAIAWAERSVEYRFGGYAFLPHFSPNAEHIATLARLAALSIQSDKGEYTPGVEDPT